MQNTLDKSLLQSGIFVRGRYVPTALIHGEICVWSLHLRGHVKKIPDQTMQRKLTRTMENREA